MLVENRQYEPTPPHYGAHVRGDSVEISPNFWQQKTGISYGAVCIILNLAVLVQFRLVTDIWTDTRRQHILR